MLVILSVCKDNKELFTQQVNQLAKSFGIWTYPVFILCGYGVDLSGTDAVKRICPAANIIGIDAEFMPYPANANYNVFTAARLAHRLGDDFIWVEADCFVLREDFVVALGEEFYRAGKPAMLTASVNAPFDVITGCGVYSKDFIVRYGSVFHGHDDGFDGQLLKRFPEAIHRSQQIHHKYGDYDPAGQVRPHHWTRSEIQNAKDRGAILLHKVWSPDNYTELEGI